MQQSPPNRPTFPKDFLDDSASMTSSTIASRQKFTRKTDERSATRRPISKGSREKGAELMDIGRFYRKMGGKAEERPSSPARKNIINREEDCERNRKRSPTPVPGYQKRREKLGNSSEQLQIQLQVCELQRRLASQQEEKQLLAKRVAVFQREIRSKLLKIQQLQTLLAATQQREALAGRKLQEFQLVIAQSESNLTQARSSLQKLKNTIKQNKYALLQADNFKFKQENAALRLQLQRVNAQVERMGHQVSFLANQVTLLRRANQHLSNSNQIQEKRREIQALQRVILTSKTQKQRSLQEMVEKVKGQNSSLRVRLQKLQMKLNLMDRKRNQELQAVKQSKNEIIIKLKNKISTIFQLNHTLRAENDQIKTKYRLKTTTSRKNNFMQQCEQAFRLQLSP